MGASTWGLGLKPTAYEADTCMTCMSYEEEEDTCMSKAYSLEPKPNRFRMGAWTCRRPVI